MIPWLTTVSAEVGVTDGTGVMDVHARVNAARDQATSTDESEEGDESARNVSDEAGFCLGDGVDFAVAGRTDHVCRLTSHRHNCRHNDRPVCRHRAMVLHRLRRSEWAGGRHTPNSLGVAGRGGRRGPMVGGDNACTLASHQAICLFFEALNLLLEVL